MRSRHCGDATDIGFRAVLIALSFAYAALLLSAPSIPLIAIGLWWTANTVAHNFIHTPFFRSRALNRAYSLFLSALMGVPQSLWRDRHLRHHAERHHGVHHAELRETGNRPASLDRDERRRRGDRRGPDGVGRGGGRGCHTLHHRVCAWLSRGTRPLSSAGTLRTRARHDQPLRMAVQLVLLQRRLSRRTSPSAWRTLDPAPVAAAGQRAEQPMAGGASLDRRAQPRVAGAEGVAIRAPPAFRPRGPRAGVQGAAPAARANPSRHHRRRRAVSAERADPAAAAARRDGGDRRRETGTPRDRLAVPGRRHRAASTVSSTRRCPNLRIWS